SRFVITNPTLRQKASHERGAYSDNENRNDIATNDGRPASNDKCQDQRCTGADGNQYEASKTTSDREMNRFHHRPPLRIDPEAQGHEEQQTCGQDYLMSLDAEPGHLSNSRYLPSSEGNAFARLNEA